MNEKGKEEEHEESASQNTSQVANDVAAMAFEGPGSVMSQQQQGQGQYHPLGSIPYEIIGDEEMAAIESALLQAHSVSFAYHSSVARASRLFPASSVADSAQPLSTSGSVFSNKLSHVPISTEKFSTSFVYNVAAESSWPTPESGVNFRSENEEADPLTSTIFSGFSAIFADELPSSQLSANYDSQPSFQSGGGGADEALSGASAPTAASEWDESACTASSTSGAGAGEDSQVSNGATAYVVSPAKRVVAGRTARAQSERRSSPKERTDAGVQDIEDVAADIAGDSSQGEGSANSRHAHDAVHLLTTPVTLFQRKSGRGLSVTDFTASEWCEKQVEFSLNRGKPEQTPAMRAGSVRHLELEKEVITRVEIEIFTKEDTWAVRLLNFISGVRQLLSEGLTRELPVVGVVRGTWVVGIIDEIRLVQTENGERPLLVDTKTRRRRTPPSEPQKRNARLQLMCYKMLWDSIVETGIQSEAFFNHFRLNPRQKLCKDVESHAASFWADSQVQCLEDLLSNILVEVGSQIYPKSVDSLVLRYELQEDRSLLGEDKFEYEPEWLMDRWHWHSHFWSGERSASLVSEDESWKCRHCSFANVCLPGRLSPRREGAEVKKQAPSSSKGDR